MAWRFKASKYKNATPIVPKPENCVRDIIVGSYQTYGHNIAASATFMAFNVDHNGISLAVLPLDDSGRKGKNMALLHGHTDTVTDICFSPFNDGLLATGSQDCLIKLWHIPNNGLEQSLTEPELVLYSKTQRRVETVLFHPNANCLLSTTSYTALNLWDVTTQQSVYTNNDDHSEVIQCINWSLDGKLLATTCKDKQLRVIDCRSKQKSVVHETSSHFGMKDSRVVWVNDGYRILTTGFNAARQREVLIRDLRNFNQTEKSLELDSSTGILLPLYDPDTNMLFLAGKGDTSIMYMEVTNREPYLIEGLRHTGEQTKGACLVPKRALNVMQGEVNRILQLTTSMVVPIMYQVPRKTYRDFHADLYPDTAGCDSELTAGDWLEGKNLELSKISLDPSKKHSGDGDTTNPLPRLGPKPFTPPKLQSSLSTDGANDNQRQNNFDKVFYVPQAPQTKPRSNSIEVQDKKDENEDAKSRSIIEDYLNDSNRESEEKLELSKKIDLEKTPSYEDKNLIRTEVENNKNYDKSPLEIGKICNQTTKKVNVETNKKLNNDDSVEEDKNSLERGSAQRTSIAERRRIYESRSVSHQDANVTVEKTSPTPVRRKGSIKSKADEAQEDVTRRSSTPKQEPATPTPKRTSTVFGRVSKFRHLKGTPGHKSTHIENIRNVSRQISGECDGFDANPERAAVPLSGPGGKIAVFELSKTGRLPDGVIPALVHGTNIMDFCWDPFDNHRLAVGCDDGIVRLWRIPAGGLVAPSNEPEAVLEAHGDKIYVVKFHPLASNILATASYDMTIRIWDLTSFEQKYCLTGHTDQVFCMSWSPCGSMLATVCKDGFIRIYKPRQSNIPIKEGKGPSGTRGARLVWALEGSFIVVIGFDKVSERQITVFKSSDLNTPLTTVGLDVSPAILLPFYDEDSSTLFLTGRGDTTIFNFEISEESPYVCLLTHHRCSSLHQGISFLNKSVCDVASVEFARALRLTNNVIEPLSFNVPRVKTELFQDDLFPPTKVTWEPSMTCTEWFKGANKPARRVNLCPPGMELLSSTQLSNKTQTSNNSSFNPASQPYNKLSAEMQEMSRVKQEQITQAVSKRLEMNLSLEQDKMEGVDEDEWDE